MNQLISVIHTWDPRWVRTRAELEASIIFAFSTVAGMREVILTLDTRWTNLRHNRAIKAMLSMPSNAIYHYYFFANCYPYKYIASISNLTCSHSITFFLFHISKGSKIQDLLSPVLYIRNLELAEIEYLLIKLLTQFRSKNYCREITSVRLMIWRPLSQFTPRLKALWFSFICKVII